MSDASCLINLFYQEILWNQLKGSFHGIVFLLKSEDKITEGQLYAESYKNKRLKSSKFLLT
jgi:hypothetical protein